MCERCLASGWSLRGGAGGERCIQNEGAFLCCLTAPVCLGGRWTIVYRVQGSGCSEPSLYARGGLFIPYFTSPSSARALYYTSRGHFSPSVPSEEQVGKRQRKKAESERLVDATLPQGHKTMPRSAHKSRGEAETNKHMTIWVNSTGTAERRHPHPSWMAHFANYPDTEDTGSHSLVKQIRGKKKIRIHR